MTDNNLYYPLDGLHHDSVATRLSALHLLRGPMSTSPLCRPSGIVDSDNAFTAEDAVREHRALCKRCLAIAANAKETARRPRTVEPWEWDEMLDLLGRAKLALMAAPNNFGATNGGALSVIAGIDKTRAKYGR